MFKYFLIAIGCIFLLLLLIISLIYYKIYKQFFGYHYHTDKYINYYTKEYYNLNCEDVQFKCKRYNLKGFLYSYPNYKEKKIVIFSHGMWSSSQVYLSDIESFCKNGYLTFAFDYIGTENSSGKNLVDFSNSIASTDAAIKYIKKRFPDYDIYLVGHSWGAFAVINSVKYNKDVKKIVAMSPFITLRRELKQFLPRKLNFIIPLAEIVNFIHFGKYAFPNGYKALKKYKGKALIIHSKDDNMISYAANTKYLEDRLENIEFYIENGKKHQSYYSDNAVELFEKFEADLKACKTKEEARNLKKNSDFRAMCEIDQRTAQKVMKFLDD